MKNYVARFQEYASGKQWHALCKQHMSKYGTDWNFSWGFDLSKLTEFERAFLLNVYRKTMLGRGIPAEKLRNIGV